jgi:hypothetical protein
MSRRILNEPAHWHDANFRDNTQVTIEKVALLGEEPNKWILMHNGWEFWASKNSRSNPFAVYDRVARLLSVRGWLPVNEARASYWAGFWQKNGGNPFADCLDRAPPRTDAGDPGSARRLAARMKIRDTLHPFSPDDQWLILGPILERIDAA